MTLHPPLLSFLISPRPLPLHTPISFHYFIPLPYLS